MKDLKEYIVFFTGLKIGKHQFRYQIDNTFFEFFNYHDFEKAAIEVSLLFEKKENLFQLEFNSVGFVTVPCDVTAEPFNLSIEGELKLIVTFGEEYNDDNDEILIIPHNSFELDVSQLIYEMIILSLPSKRVHPGVDDGTLSSEVLERLHKFEKKQDENKTIDPRWAKLKELQTNKKE